jgi:hypothetical protein
MVRACSGLGEEGSVISGRYSPCEFSSRKGRMKTSNIKIQTSKKRQISKSNG